MSDKIDRALRIAGTKRIAGAKRIAKADGGSLQDPMPDRPSLVHVGPIHSFVAGRTDHLPAQVPSGSYVIPADIISAMGEGNTMAGFKQMRRIFGGNPYGGIERPYDQGNTPYNEPLPRAAGGRIPTPKEFQNNYMAHMDIRNRGADAAAVSDNISQNGFKSAGFGPNLTPPWMGGRPQNIMEEKFLPKEGDVAYLVPKKGWQKTGNGMKIAEGWKPASGEVVKVQHDGQSLYDLHRLALSPDREHRASGGPAKAHHTVPVVIAGGEYVLSPEQVKMVGDGDMEAGHRVLDEFVKRFRKETIKTLQKLPGPKKD